MFTKHYTVLRNRLLSEKSLQLDSSYILLKVKDMSFLGFNYYIYDYNPDTDLAFCILDRLDGIVDPDYIFYLHDLTGPFYYFNQEPYARTHYMQKYNELNKSNKQIIRF